MNDSSGPKETFRHRIKVAFRKLKPVLLLSVPALLFAAIQIFKPDFWNERNVILLGASLLLGMLIGAVFTAWQAKLFTRPFKLPERIFTSLPRTWELFPYLMFKGTREKVYEPAHCDLMHDYLLAKRKYRTKWARRWLTFCFCLRTAVLFFGSIKAALGDKFIRGLEKIAPGIVHWWLRK